MAASKSILDIEINDEQFKKLEQNFEKFKQSVGSTPRDWKNLTSQFNATAKVLSGITHNISSWTVNLRQATQAMKEFAKEAAGVSRAMPSSSTGRGGGGGATAALARVVART